MTSLEPSPEEVAKWQHPLGGGGFPLLFSSLSVIKPHRTLSEYMFYAVYCM